MSNNAVFFEKSQGSTVKILYITSYLMESKRQSEKGKGKKMLSGQLKQFKTPGAEYRGAPFWAWNAKLESSELIRQIHLMKEMGLGGFFMHSRVGLNTEYLGGEWFSCVRACIAEAEKLGMNAWLYDEDRWPSGAAGSLVTREDRFKQKSLYLELPGSVKESNGTGNSLAWYAVRLDGTRLLSCRRFADPEDMTLADGEQLLRCYWCHAEKSSWFNGETYLDTMNEEAVKRFVEVTHEAYRREVGAQFGKTVPGIFTDEPCYTHFNEKKPFLPWTDSIPGKFREKYGYDLLDFLPELFYETAEEVSRARWNFYDLITSLFVNAFSRIIGEWCKENNMKMTGHVLAEDTLSSQTLYVGSAMRFYEYMQAPGIDLLTEHWNIFNTAKQCVSVARQLGRETRLSETYGCTGWDFPFFGHKALGDWQFALGINLRCQHLAWYSMSAEAKRDYPASISYQSPWFRHYRHVEDYFGRIGSVISDGEEIRDILMIHPVESCWSLTWAAARETPEKILKLEAAFVRVPNLLLSENLDFDFGDEELFSRYGSVSGKSICVGKASYKAVVIPELRTIRSTTLKLLGSFAEQGGTVVYLGAPPCYVDAVRSGEAERVYENFRALSEEALPGELSKIARRVSLTTPDGAQARPLLCRLAENGEALSLFICNVGKEFSEDHMRECLVRERTLVFPSVDVSVAVPERGRVYELDPEHGTIHAVDAVYENGAYRFRTFFDELSSRLFLITRESVGAVLPAKKYTEYRTVKELPGTGWNITRDEPNVLVLDHAACYVNGEKKHDRAYILKIDDDLREMLGKPARGGAMVQPWLREKTTPARTLDVVLEYAFDCETLPEEDCFLAVEHPELYSILVNGNALDPNTDSWWVDLVLRRLRLPVSFLKKGRNVITITSRYHENLPGLEAIFLLGEFGVTGNDVLCAVPRTLSAGDWCEQGLPFYSGNMSCDIPLGELPAEGRIYLRMPEWRGVALGVRVNGGEEIFLPWAPMRADLTELLRRDGSDTVAVTVYGHRRNAFGPFYLKEKWPAGTGPLQFKMYEVPERQLVPCGLLKAPVVETER